MAVVKPPGTGTLPEQLRQLQSKVDELSRRKGALPVCRVHLTADATNLAANTDIWAQGNWAATEDSLGMFHPGGSGTNSYIQLPIAGYWSVEYHSAMTGPNAQAASKVCLNAANVVGSTIATDSQIIPIDGGDGAVLDARKPRAHYNAGDKLYWSNWCIAAGANLPATVFTVRAEITVLYLSS